MTPLGATITAIVIFCAGFFAWVRIVPPKEPPPPPADWWDEDRGGV